MSPLASWLARPCLDSSSPPTDTLPVLAGKALALKLPNMGEVDLSRGVRWPLSLRFKLWIYFLLLLRMSTASCSALTSKSFDLTFMRPMGPGTLVLM